LNWDELSILGRNHLSKSKSLLRRYGGFVVSAVFLYYIVFHSGVSFADFKEGIKEVSFFDLVVLAVLYLIPYPIRAVRACLLLPQLSFSTSLAGVFVGYAANNILPFRLGEVVRAQVVGRYTGERRSLVLSSVLIERVFDGFAIVLLLFIGARSLNLPEWAVQARIIGISLFTCALGGVFLVGLTVSFWENFIERFIPWAGLKDFAMGILEGVKLATRNIPSGLGVLGLSFLIWGLEGGMYWYGFQAFGIEGSVFEALFVLGIINLGVLLPSSPGFVGVFEAFAVNSLAVIGVSKGVGLAYGVVLHLLQYVPVTAIGMIYFYRYGVRITSLQNVPEQLHESMNLKT
jgi:glycosyltransferase 2 family protein